MLYKERNLILTEKERARKMRRPITSKEEVRYNYVKRAMGGIKKVLAERKKLDAADAEQKAVEDSKNSEGSAGSESVQREA